MKDMENLVLVFFRRVRQQSFRAFRNDSVTNEHWGFQFNQCSIFIVQIDVKLDGTSLAQSSGIVDGHPFRTALLNTGPPNARIRNAESGNENRTVIVMVITSLTDAKVARIEPPTTRQQHQGSILKEAERACAFADVAVRTNGQVLREIKLLWSDAYWLIIPKGEDWREVLMMIHRRFVVWRFFPSTAGNGLALVVSNAVKLFRGTASGQGDPLAER